MTYRRVIPRDLFNEGNLLKCLGRLYTETEKITRPVTNANGEGTVNAQLVVLLHTGDDFRVVQSTSDGSIRVTNITIIIGGITYDHYRPLNSRMPWPLYIEKRNCCDPEPVEVFDDMGNLSQEMLTELARYK